MGFKVFAFKQRSENGESERVRYVYASEKETVRCRRELLQRLREECVAVDLSAIIDDETVFGAELVNDAEFAQVISSDDATSDTASIEPAEDPVLLVSPMPADDCDLLQSLPEPDDLPDGDDVFCEEMSLESEEEDFFDSLREWLYESDGIVTQRV